MRERRILILADGRRTLEDVIAMLGDDIRPAVDRLVREGYLSRSARAPVAMEIAKPVAPIAPVATPAPAARRRSLVAAKMYLIDMLQLQRSTEAADLRLAIQSTGDEALLVERLLERWRTCARRRRRVTARACANGFRKCCPKHCCRGWRRSPEGSRASPAPRRAMRGRRRAPGRGRHAGRRKQRHRFAQPILVAVGQPHVRRAFRVVRERLDVAPEFALPRVRAEGARRARLSVAMPPASSISVSRARSPR